MAITRRNFLRSGTCTVFVAAYATRARTARAQSASTTFDYYIGPSGSDSNPGTMAQPWAITAINTQRSVYAGKRVGLLDGVYNVYALHQAANGNAPALCVQGGTAQSPTVIQAVNARKVIISADSSGGTTGGSYPTAGGGIIGQAQNSQQSVWGNVILDGLYITRAYQFGIALWGEGSGEGGTTGCVVRNCEIYDIDGWENGNMCGVLLWQQTGALVSNCKIHSVIPNTGNVALWDCSGIGGQNNHANIYEYNTIYNCNTGIYDKNSGSGGHTYRYNYIDSTGTYPNACIQDGGGGNTGDTLTAHHNVMVCSVGQNQGLWYGQDALVSASHSSTTIYNNTFLLIGSGAVGEVYVSSAGGGVSPAAKTTFYNNIVYYSGGSIGYAGLVDFGPQGYVTSDYNCFYQPGAGASTALLGMDSGSADAPSGGLHTLSSWQSTFGLDTHSLVANPSLVSATNAGAGGAPNSAGYQLNTGSPCLNAGRVGGTSSGAACNMGAWDGTATQIGCDFDGAIPTAPVLSIS